MSFSKYLGLAVSVAYLLTSAAQAKGSAYFRATALVEEDPMEADALFASVIHDSGEPKIRRAAIHQLFYLRLRTGRVAEAFSLANTETMRKKYTSATAAYLKMPEKNAERLLARLRSACAKQYDLQKLAGFLEEKNTGAAGYDFALRVIKKCRPEDAVEILPQPEGWADLDRRTLALALIAIREGKTTAGQAEPAQLLADLRMKGAGILEKDAALRGQLLIIEARLGIRNSEFTLVTGNCRQIGEDDALKKFRGQCRFLTAFALLKENRPAEAYALMASQKIQPMQIDNRLLRLIAAVAAGKLPRERLRKFMRRASYPECAMVLRELAESTLK